MKTDTVIRRVGPVPFWRGEKRVLEQLEEIYRKAMEAAAKTDF